MIIIKILTITSRTISIELKNKDAYYTDEYSLFLNNEFLWKDNRNVFTIFDLEPNTTYTLKINYEIEFTTKAETMLLNVKDFNAYGDGKHDDTLSLQWAILCCPVGGTIYIPKGEYRFTTLFLKSDVMLYLDKEAYLKANYDRHLFPILRGMIKGNIEMNLGTWEGSFEDCFASPITAINSHNVIIAGEGTIDGNALNGDWYEDYHTKRGAWRPFGMFFNRCQNMEVVGITIKNSPSWNVHPYFSKDLKFINMKIFNPHNMPTTDGLDPDCCENVLIAGVYFSVGDDCIAIKSGVYEMAKKYNTPSKNIEITNCLMEEGHGGVVFGSESSAGIKEINVHNCFFKNTDRGLRIKTRRGRGRVGTIDNVNFDNIVMVGVKVPFVINMFYNMGPKGGHEEYVWTKEPQPVNEFTPLVGKFHFKNMKCFKTKVSAGEFLGLPESPIEEITIEDVCFTYDEEAEMDYPVMIEHKKMKRRAGLNFLNVNKVVLRNVSLKGQDGEKLLLEGVKEKEGSIVDE